MKIILNRIAWVASLALGYIFFMMFARMLGIFSSYLYGGLPGLISLFIFGALIKKVFLSSTFIERNLSKIELEKNVAPIPVEKEKDVSIPEIIEDKVMLSGGMQDEFNEEEPVVNSLGMVVSKEKIDSKPESIPSRLSSIEPKSESENIKEDSKILAQDDSYFKKEVSKEEEKRKENVEPGFIQQFFAENALAKIGGILLFLGVLFLLQLVYTVIGPVGKLMVGFGIGMTLFGIGSFLDSRGHQKEARIVIGTSILINYLVILSGRYLIQESSMAGKMILNESVTFFFLIANTVFAIAASLVYKSNALLFFAFVISYLNPLLIGAKETYAPYTLLGYSLIISFGALAMSYFLSKKSKVQSLNLTHVAFLGGSILILLAPFTSNMEWIVKLGALTILSFITLMFLYKQNNKIYISGYFVAIYLFFFILLQMGGIVLGAEFNNFSVFVSYSLFAFIALGSSVYFFVATSFMAFFYVIFAPLLIFLVLIISGMTSVDNTIWLLVFSMVAYIGIFSITSNILVSTMKYFLFGLLGIFVVIVNVILGNISKGLSFGDILFLHIVGIMISTYIFYLSAYFFSTKKGMESLYSLGTLFGILMVLPVISREGEFRIMSIIGISGLVIFNLLLPIVNRRLLESNIQNLVFGVVLGAIFTVSQIYYFMFGDNGKSPMTLGLVFVFLALIYFAQSYFIYLRVIESRKQAEDSGKNKLDANIFYTFVALSISIFSLAIAFVFSGSPEIISIVWLLEASILYFFYKRTSNLKIYIFAFVMMVVGLTKILSFIGSIHTGQYSKLIPAIIIFISIVLSLRFLEKEKSNIRSFHDLGHVIGILLVIAMILLVTPTHNGYNTLALAFFSILLFILYSRIFAAQAKYLLLFYLLIVMTMQIMQLDTVFNYLERSGDSVFKILQYLSTIVLASGVFSFNVLAKHYKENNKIERNYYLAINIISSLYLFIITTQYVYHFIDKNIFVIAIYWGLLAFFFLSRGINTDNIKFRTLGLYILTLAVGKIVLNDIWNGLDNAVMRVIALMFVGGILIAVSILYSKKYGNQLKGEFSLDNLLNEEKGKIISSELD